VYYIIYNIFACNCHEVNALMYMYNWGEYAVVGGEDGEDGIKAYGCS